MSETLRELIHDLNGMIPEPRRVDEQVGMLLDPAFKDFHLPPDDDGRWKRHPGVLIGNSKPDMRSVPYYTRFVDECLVLLKEAFPLWKIEEVREYPGGTWSVTLSNGFGEAAERITSSGDGLTLQSSLLQAMAMVQEKYYYARADRPVPAMA